MQTFTFKKEPEETGLRRVTNPVPATQIKMHGFHVGYIYPPHRNEDRKWKIRLAIVKTPTEENPAPFKWITLMARFDKESEAREFILLKTAALLNLYNLHKFPKGE